MPRTLEDLQKLTGRSRRTVVKEIEAGNMPGYRIGGTNNFHIPDEAFELYAQGYWVERDKRQIQPTPFLVRRVLDEPATQTG